MTELLGLPNVGKVLHELLTRAGITSAEQLRDLGTQEVFLRVRELDSTACLHMLYGIEGAVQGVRDTQLDADTKARLRQFYKTL